MEIGRFGDFGDVGEESTVGGGFGESKHLAQVDATILTSSRLGVSSRSTNGSRPSRPIAKVPLPASSDPSASVPSSTCKSHYVNLRKRPNVNG